VKDLPPVGETMLCNITKNCYTIERYFDLDPEVSDEPGYYLIWQNGASVGVREYYPITELEKDAICTPLLKALL
jgi:hypothetical protein